MLDKGYEVQKPNFRRQNADSNHKASEMHIRAFVVMDSEVYVAVFPQSKSNGALVLLSHGLHVRRVLKI